MPRLLLVEDHAPLARSLSDGLRTHGYTVDVAPSIAAAGRRVECFDYDVAVVDRALPDGDGLSWIRGLRAAGEPLPILVLSARDAVDDRVEGLEGGADDYLTKPFALRELVVRLAVLRRRAAGRILRRVTVGDLVVDVEACTAHRAGRPLDLSRRQFSALACLAARAGRVVSRADLEAYVYGDEPPNSNAIEVHIAHLRAKLDAAGDRPLLHTLRGLGYRLSEEP